MPRLEERDALDAYSTLVNYAAERVGPAVVKIEIEATRQAREPTGRGTGQWRHLSAGDGQILTNAHVVQNARTVRVILADGRQFEAGLIGADRDARYSRNSNRRRAIYPWQNSANIAFK